jgi:hypothetical protein
MLCWFHPGRSSASSSGQRSHGAALQPDLGRRMDSAAVLAQLCPGSELLVRLVQGDQMCLLKNRPKCGQTHLF